MRVLAAGVGVVPALIAAGFVAQKLFGSGDKTTEGREALEALPYRVSVREAAEGVLVGSARGGHEVVVHFAVSREGPEPHDIPPHLIQADRNVTGGGGFWVWDDSEFWLRHGTGPAWNEAAKIAVAIEEALCRKVTGDACGI